MERKLYAVLASLVQARANCNRMGNEEWFVRHSERIEQVVRDFLPSGSGIDSGCSIDLDASTEDKIVLNTSYHHMNEGGYYDGWTEHTITVRPSLAFGIRVSIGGRDRNDIKEYLHDVFHTALMQEIVQATAAPHDYRLAYGLEKSAA